jgi:hypothetical protein
MDLRNLSAQVFGAAMQVAFEGDERQASAARRVLTDARKRLYLILAEDDPASRGPETGGDPTPNQP